MLDNFKIVSFLTDRFFGDEFSDDVRVDVNGFVVNVFVSFANGRKIGRSLALS